MVARRGIDIEIEGLRDLNRALGRFGTEAKQEIKDLHLEGARRVETVATQIVPRRTGKLGSTIRSAGTLKGAQVRAGFARVPYAGVIHFGWPGHNIRPQPWLYDALDKRRDKVLEAYDDGLSKLIRKYDLD
jgi:hypothetical protein